MNRAVKGIKTAVSDWNATGNIAARLYYNKDTGRVWVNEYASGNDWSSYDNPAIVELAAHDDLNFMKMHMKDIVRLVIESYGY